MPEQPLKKPKVAMRSPEMVMRLARMGCFHQTRLSFMRALLRQLKRDNWHFARTQFDVDDHGEGVVVYQAIGPERCYSLICFAHDLPPEKRSDRVIADQWDATFALFDGVPTAQDIARLQQNVPYQEAGQCSEKELVLSRANRSVRLFNHVVDRLAEGQQPDLQMIENVGYLMRTTAVYGNGKFGLCDRERIAGRDEFCSAFRTELLAVWLIRWFTVDIVEYMAQVKNPNKAVPLNADLKTRFGVGNSTGLGMAPFLVTHPALLHTWMSSRETAFMRVRNVAYAEADKQQVFVKNVKAMQQSVESWQAADPRQADRVVELSDDLQRIEQYLVDQGLGGEQPWNQLVQWSESSLSVEGQELVVSLVIEPYGELVDDLADQMAIDEAPFNGIDGSMTAAKTRQLLEQHYAWALDLDYAETDHSARFWYVSEEKLEPRLGQRYEEPGAEKEQPLAFARDMAALYTALENIEPNQSVSTLLMQSPEHRGAMRRLQLADKLPYAEIRDNLICAEMVPVDLLRCKLSFFGANKFDPRSDRWTRITMYQGAPYPNEFDQCEADNWILPQQ